MIEWIIIIILAIAFGVVGSSSSEYVSRLLNNVQVRLAELYFLVKEYDQFCKKVEC